MRLIDADNLKNILWENTLNGNGKLELMSIIDNAETIIPFASVEYETFCEYERPHGEWIEQEEPDGHYNSVDVAACSYCGETYVLGEMGIDDVKREFNFCPSCGAQMDGGKS